MNRRHALRQLGALSAAACAAGPLAALAQNDKPITIVVPYAPGGTTDMLGRLIAQQLGTALGRTVIVDNKPGAGTAIGASQVARSAPDGSTLLVATSTTLAINPWLYKKLSYDPAKDFAPVGLIGAVPLMVVVHPSVPARTLAELVALAKSKPEGLSYGSAGNGSPQHLGAEMFKFATGTAMTHVPYKGSALALTDLLGGQLQLMFTDIAPALQHVRSGKLRALAVTSKKRQPTFPDVPTVAESRLPGTADFEAVAWQSIVAPAGTPAPVVERLSQEIAKVIAQPALRQKLENDGFEPGSSTPAQLAAYIRSESERWGQVIRASGATVD
ncbi:ABC transporter substrate-binding protein [Variovorax paradoxus]|jgi:tripartite-type tricarboxylate transporter receptor subunit TctC|uniref:Bug family tripartite tricarboxylate transporter substrate binding protein n=1 Tax=Variovorax TaxID=34072 RepID=UPI0006E71362|nr:tripartite tricarboxylate transporter substrate binding protein [Variovorax sp. PDC80]KPU97539.1 ABC transporter substrate-binding protein [Variovorax paradoxus]KPV06953.1 ABC transporter substrate-binding protein [Variovorax paradoxus]KPV07168.1 ABC transporter substrate-binding protein [Variovorax paradoxus]KPV20707.1 ABC transporter substrate-binding protein [Variovorax paradoxus]KPV31357.1 ABC transporter substrate-binding protein [Variovorax paradoxus]